jgi:murein DD-endopeptidase MepM/ murein hydrolase activator NlpD
MRRGRLLVLGLVTVTGCATAPPPTSRIVILPSSSSCAILDWPVSAPLASPFGRRDGRPHEGIDLSVPDGTEVRAACDGIVAYVGARRAGYGKLVVVQHGEERATAYAHNQQLLVREGQAVSRGQTIALSGHTGRATGPHLHFEVRDRGRAVDPLPLLQPLAPPIPPRVPPLSAERE